MSEVPFDHQAVMSNQHCPNTARCRLYGEFNLEASMRTWQIRYCHNNFAACERYQRQQDGVPIPPRLLPSGDMLPEKKTG